MNTNIKFIESIETDKVSMEIYECECGYHMGVDSSFLEQVSHIASICPSCEKEITISDSTEEVELVPMSELDKVLAEHNVKPYTDEGAKVCRAWLKETKTTLYEVPKEDFSLDKAYALASREGNVRLIASHLS